MFLSLSLHFKHFLKSTIERQIMFLYLPLSLRLKHFIKLKFNRQILGLSLFSFETFYKIQIPEEVVIPSLSLSLFETFLEIQTQGQRMVPSLALLLKHFLKLHFKNYIFLSLSSFGTVL